MYKWYPYHTPRQKLCPRLLHCITQIPNSSHLSMAYTYSSYPREHIIDLHWSIMWQWIHIIIRTMVLEYTTREPHSLDYEILVQDCIMLTYMTVYYNINLPHNQVYKQKICTHLPKNATLLNTRKAAYFTITSTWYKFIDAGYFLYGQVSFTNVFNNISRK